MKSNKRYTLVGTVEIKEIVVRLQGGEVVGRAASNSN